MEWEYDADDDASDNRSVQMQCSFRSMNLRDYDMG
jgi:hypothetical protein